MFATNLSHGVTFLKFTYSPPKTKKIQDSERSGFPSVTGFRAHLCCTLALAPAETHVNLVGRATNLYQVVLKLQPAIQRYTAEFAATRPVSDRHRVLFHRKSNTAGKCVEDYDGKLDFKSNLCEEVQDYQDRCVNSTRSFQMWSSRCLHRHEQIWFYYLAVGCANENAHIRISPSSQT